jgi:TrmH family RNA methyltransferase
MNVEISSRANPRLKELLAQRDELIFFEGEKLAADVLSRDRPVRLLLFTGVMENRLPKITAAVGEYWRVSRAVMRKISQLKTPPEIIAVAEMPAAAMDFRGGKVVFGFDAIQDPANLGAVFRCAAAFEISALALAGACVRCNHPKVVRAAQTALIDTPFMVFADLGGMLAAAQRQDLRIYVTGSHAGDRILAVEAMEFPCLVLFGSEGQGLERRVLERFPQICLGQSTRIDSLNVAVSACILMHELRQVHGL